VIRDLLLSVDPDQTITMPSVDVASQGLSQACPLRKDLQRREVLKILVIEASAITIALCRHRHNPPSPCVVYSPHSPSPASSVSPLPPPSDSPRGGFVF
jgi:hypothetical protein